MPTKDEAFVIPTIDLGPYLLDRSSPAAAQIVADVRAACMTTGFFSLTGHGISSELQQRVFAAAKAFFALPLEEKIKIRAPPPLKRRGYEIIGGQGLQEGAKPDLKEGYYIGVPVASSDPRARQYPHLIGENVFPSPDLLPDEVMREPTERYMGEVYRVACTVMEILAKGLGHGDGVFDELLSDDPLSSLKLLHYPPQGPGEKELGAGAHTDFGAITLLLQDDSGGLEVLNGATGEWVPVAPNPDAFVVNIGDMLAMWTKNVYKSNTHRVINMSMKDRYSVPFFFDGKPEVKLAPLDGSEVPGEKVLTVMGHMEERFGTVYSRGKTVAA